MHQIHQPNTKGKDYIVSDIHGCYADFMKLLQEVNFNSEVDRVFSVGDLIDRGPDNYKCLLLMYEPWFIPVKGNHEDLFVNAIKHSNLYLWKMNGGDWHDKDDPLLPDLVKDVDELPIFITLHHKSGKKIGICHAECPVMDWEFIDKPLDSYALQSAIWGRTRVKLRNPLPVSNIDFTVHGHTVLEETKWQANSFFIDTGSFLGTDLFEGYDGHITLIDVDRLCEGGYHTASDQK